VKIKLEYSHNAKLALTERVSNMLNCITSEKIFGDFFQKSRISLLVIYCLRIAFYPSIRLFSAGFAAFICLFSSKIHLNNCCYSSSEIFRLATGITEGDVALETGWLIVSFSASWTRCSLTSSKLECLGFVLSKT